MGVRLTQMLPIFSSTKMLFLYGDTVSCMQQFMGEEAAEEEAESSTLLICSPSGDVDKRRQLLASLGDIAC